ncbi:TRAF-type zinc finger domain-containing protein 1 [Spea bombifrons]|uniref:TRAF-type zinc finger domain-containing protein 1 n=1 Tax=Spea bombifrons TaxID=233779 RepID=UPI00234BE8F2|nr:TRAF-type zinc finger domain-containing protein 1 [Spea bombifrons]
MASEGEQETRLCGNCKRDIPSINFTMHEIHCKRNISVCRKCKEPFPTSDMEEHMTSEHAPVTCKCKMIMEKRELEEHEHSACPLRMTKCQFCELELQFAKLGDHEDYCGARTERCDQCERSVMTKDLKDHPKVCGKETEPKKPTGLRNQLDYDGTEDDGAWFESWNNRNPFRESGLRGHVPSRFYGRSVLTQSLKNVDRVAEKNRVTEQNLSKNIPAKPREQHGAGAFSERPFQNHGRSKMNSFQFTSFENDGRSSPDPDPLECDDFWKQFHSEDIGKTKNTRGWMDASLLPNNEAVQFDPFSIPDTNDIQLPCEFCEELFPEHDLILHQSGCNTNPLISNGRFPPRPVQEFKEDPILDWMSKPSVQTKRSSPSPLPVHQPHSVFIPCEFCGVLIDGEILFHHQDQCDMCPSSETFPPVSPPPLPVPDKNTKEETGFFGKPPTGLSVKGDVVPSFRNNQKKENSTAHPRSLRSRGPEEDRKYQPKSTNVSRAAPPTRRSTIEEIRRTNMEENMRLSRRPCNDYADPPFFGSSLRRDPVVSAAASNLNPRNKPKTRNVNTRSGDVQKEE